VLCAVWFLAAVLAGRSAMVRGSLRWGCLSAAFGVMAALSKENAVALPVVLLAYDWLLRPGGDPARRRRLWLVFVPIFAIGAAAAAYRITTLSAVSMGAAPASPGLNALTQAIVIWRYLGLLAWPAGQSIMHGVHRVTTPGDPLAWAAVLGLAALALAAFVLRRREPLVTLSAAWFFAALAPSSSFIALREGMAEHRVYLAGAGLMLALAAGAARLLARAPASRAARPASFIAGTAVILTALGALTVMRNQVWRSPVALWTEATQAAPDMWEARYALGDALRDAGQCERAVPEYEQVVAAHPRHRDALTNLGICLGQTGRYEESERAFRRALDVDPSFARGYTNLGALALVMGDPERARDFYREAIAQEPGNVLARLQLARLYELTFNEYRSAARMCGEARALAPETPGLAECVERNERLAAAAGR
jgi:tetratricopeptide (TPR) repeat protein